MNTKYRKFHYLIVLRENRSTPHILFPSKGKIVCTWIELHFLEKTKHSLDLHSVVLNLKGSVVRRSFSLSLSPPLLREKKGWILGSGMIDKKNDRALVVQEGIPWSTSIQVPKIPLSFYLSISYTTFCLREGSGQLIWQAWRQHATCFGLLLGLNLAYSSP